MVLETFFPAFVVFEMDVHKQKNVRNIDPGFLQEPCVGGPEGTPIEPRAFLVDEVQPGFETVIPQDSRPMTRPAEKMFAGQEMLLGTPKSERFLKVFCDGNLVLHPMLRVTTVQMNVRNVVVEVNIPALDRRQFGMPHSRIQKRSMEQKPFPRFRSNIRANIA